MNLLQRLYFSTTLLFTYLKVLPLTPSHGLNCSCFHSRRTAICWSQSSAALQVIVQQLWHYLLSCSLLAPYHPSYMNPSGNICKVLTLLRQKGIDWADLGLWPREDLTDGESAPISPIKCLLAGSSEVTIAVCTGQSHFALSSLPRALPYSRNVNCRPC